MEVVIHVFGGLRDYFDPRFYIKLLGESNIEGVMDRLKAINPKSTGILDHSRIAVAERFTSRDYVIHEKDEIYIMPPSSGG
ncbi:MAG TPA: hypothetical protein ENI73_05490 [Spirochaetes bacterium]|nr:hypothetical protein [Spirochaetota bacterium]